MKQNRVLLTGLIFPTIVCILQFKTESIQAAKQAQQGDVRYLLIFKAWPPHEKRERNLYELTREIRGFIDQGFPPSGVLTDGGARYDVYNVRNTRVLSITNSHQSTRPAKDGAYFLVYDPIYKLCARTYTIKMVSPSKGKIIYVDYIDGKRYEFPIATRRAISIYELEVSTENIFRQLWEEKRRDK